MLASTLRINLSVNACINVATNLSIKVFRVYCVYQMVKHNPRTNPATKPTIRGTSTLTPYVQFTNIAYVNPATRAASFTDSCCNTLSYPPGNLFTFNRPPGCSLIDVSPPR